MRAGDLRHRVTIQQHTTATDGAGGHTKTWATYLTSYAAVTPVTGLEPFMQMQERPEVTHVVKLRHRPGVTSAMRVLYGTRTLKITTVIDPDERKRELHLHCVEERAA